MKLLKRDELDRIPCDKKFCYNGNETFFTLPDMRF